MKVLLVHNYYQQPGGEDVVFEHERSLLLSRGHRVRSFVVSNSERSSQRGVGLRLESLLPLPALRQLKRTVEDDQPDVVHFHNIFYRLSPAAFWVARRAGGAVVHTLHNYRLICPAANLMLRGSPCERCVDRRLAWPGIANACFKQSRAATAALAVTIAGHRMARTFHRDVDAFICLTQFARTLFVRGGLPPQRLHVKPNSAPNRDVGMHDRREVLYVGRLSEEKGVQFVIQAAARLPGTSFVIVGAGPLERWIANAIQQQRLTNIEMRGHLHPNDVAQIMGSAALMVLPSLCYEGLPMTIVEAYSAGLPVVASRIGSLSDLVHHDATGALVPPADPAALASMIASLLDDSTRLRDLGHTARTTYERLYSPEANYQQLLSVYKMAISHRHRSSIDTPG